MSGSHFDFATSQCCGLDIRSLIFLYADHFHRRFENKSLFSSSMFVKFWLYSDGHLTQIHSRLQGSYIQFVDLGVLEPNRACLRRTRGHVETVVRSSRDTQGSLCRGSGKGRRLPGPSLQTARSEGCRRSRGDSNVMITLESPSPNHSVNCHSTIQNDWRTYTAALIILYRLHAHAQRRLDLKAI